MTFVAALCIYFTWSVVHEFGFSGDEHDTRAVFHEKPPRWQWPAQKENFGSEEQSYTMATSAVPEPCPNSVENICLVLWHWNMAVITYQQLPRLVLQLVLQLVMASFGIIVQLNLKPLWWLCKQLQWCDLWLVPKVTHQHASLGFHRHSGIVRINIVFTILSILTKTSYSR